MARRCLVRLHKCRELRAVGRVGALLGGRRARPAPLLRPPSSAPTRPTARAGKAERGERREERERPGEGGG